MAKWLYDIFAARMFVSFDYSVMRNAEVDSAVYVATNNVNLMLVMIENEDDSFRMENKGDLTPK